MRHQSPSTQTGPLLLKYLSPERVRAVLAADPRLIVPVGKIEERGPHLPVGCDTIIVERLADDLSAAFGVLRAPTIEYGVNATSGTICPGSAGVRRKTLHRFLNDLVGQWEGGGVSQFIVLMARAYDPHQEALSTLHTRRSTVRAVDVLAVPQLTEGPESTAIPDDQIDAALLSYIDERLVAQPGLVSRERSERLYRLIHDRIAERVFRSDRVAAPL